MYPNLKIQMWRRGIRQNRLAQMLGMHETALSKMVNGFRTPDPAIRQQIAALLESEEAWLFETAECRNPKSNLADVSGEDLSRTGTTSK